MKIMDVDKGMVYFKAYLSTSPEILMHLNSNISDDPVTWYLLGMPTSQM
jgi:hypothetical protein